MFKLSVYSNNQSKVYFFTNPEKVAIGRLEMDGPVVPVENEEIAYYHLTIERSSSGDYFLYNTANDPFATVNGDPFGRRKLQDNDLVSIGQASLLFQEIPEASTKSAENPEDHLSTILNEAILSKSTSVESNGRAELNGLHSLEMELEELEKLSYANEEFASTREEMEADPFPFDEIEALVKEVEALEWEEAKAISSFREKKIYSKHCSGNPLPLSPYVPHTSVYTHSSENQPDQIQLKQDEFPPFEAINKEIQKEIPTVDEEENLQKQSHSQPISWFSLIYLKWWLILIGVGLLVLFFLSGSIFFYMHTKRHIEEIKAAQGISDIAMALTYARVNQIKLQNQNWSNPSFLKKNLGAILSPKYQILATIDSQGQLSNSPYLLRIYPNHDLSQFLVIAQPAPSPFQSIFPRKTLIVDSREMELRTLKDLRELNRLISNAKTFDHFDSTASSAIIKEGELIPLTSLTLSDSKLGFSPPRSLAVLRPGAENRIYNAPRYYLFGERILEQAISLETEEYAQGARQILQHDLSELNRLPNLVLYSTSGMTKALQAQKALASIAPDNNVLVGYLKLNPQGKVISSQLLMKHALPDDSQAIASLDDNFPTTDERQNTYPYSLAIKESSPKNLEDFKTELTAIQIKREQVLGPLAQQLSSLILHSVKEPREGFSELAARLWNEFQIAEKKQNEENAHELRLLLNNYSEVSMEELMQLIETSGMKALSENGSSITALSDSISYEFSQRLNTLSKVTSLEELRATIQSCIAWLSLKYFPHFHQMIVYQKQLHNKVIEKLNDFLLSPQSPLSFQAFTAANRPLLETIFQLAWIKDDEIQKHFMNEYDIIATHVTQTL